MANGIPFHDNIDMNQNELQNFSLEKLAADPAGGDLFEGRIGLIQLKMLLRYIEILKLRFLLICPTLAGAPLVAMTPLQVSQRREPV